ncbi:hypothetical protein SUGI_1107320 [Cryptomeria japonica]|uniref:translocase of chloroplast 120, chloroplastic n=1 Tax=Cryptomeria japonica TaxID=3369 RepID=UPI002414AAC3|nr:translocase of chloroplast 120, chloroplastic [Cryptomeria japonica]XP_057836255.1 translocase of chloroplast 120, chloroplastic [Cryptomeria japonica]XP_057836259.1 translocase of chloroplast 120, chloroplastic [Cryptomeria japonica]XP_057836268.1 translocase of chloroplast 120, chloroplastic [Cryptomeria japonica]XP_057836274.1 translocase of chloroplast 120, chloroplastic [Cryptomeria japonica]XP_057836281.1 translocase of chloroplast 120, chloroplastic [Cryptomeria japonica]GLJ52066.1 
MNNIWTDSRRVGHSVDTLQEKRERNNKLKQNEIEKQKEEAVFENMIVFEANKYRIKKQLKIRNDENHDIKENKDKKHNNSGGQDPCELVPEYDGRAILLFPNAYACDCDLREIGLPEHCIFEYPPSDVADKQDIALKEAGTHEIHNAMNKEPTIVMEEVHTSPCGGKVQEYQMSSDAAGLLFTVITKSEIMSESVKKQVRAVEKDLGVGVEKKVLDKLRTYRAPIKECGGEELTETPASNKGLNVDEGNIYVEKLETKTQLGSQVTSECYRQQVGAEMEVVQVENEEIEIARDIDVNDDENRIMLDSYAGNECQDKINGSLIDELSLCEIDEAYKFQTVDQNLLEFQGVINRECVDEFGEVAWNASQGFTQSSIDILQSNDVELIVNDLGIIKSVDVVKKADRELKPLEDTQTDKKHPKHKNIGNANVSIRSTPVGGIDEDTITVIDWKQDCPVLKENDSEIETHELLDATFAEEKQHPNKVSTVGFQIREIMENSDNAYKSPFNRKSLSEFDFPVWSPKAFSGVVDVRPKSGNFGDDDTESEEEDDLHANVTALLPSNSSLVPGAACPAGIESAVHALGHVPPIMHRFLPNVFSVPESSSSPMNKNNELNETQEKLQVLRVKFLRLMHRFCQTPDNFVVGQVLYRLGLAEQLWWSRNSRRTGPFKFDTSNLIAQELEASQREDLDFTCTILVLGKTGVGKSATINSIFGEVKSETNAFRAGTKVTQEIVGTINGIQVRVIDTPGLLVSCSDQSQNGKILASVKRFIRKTPPDIVLYIDRLDMQSKGKDDLPLLCTITDAFRPEVWSNAILVLTHAASAPPDGPYGTPISYETYISQRSQAVQQTIRQAAGDMQLINPVSLVENHTSCRTDRVGQRILPNGQIWKTDLLLLCFASKILAEASSLLKLKDGMHEKPLVTHVTAPPLPLFLYSLLQSRSQLKLPEEQLWDVDVSDDGLEDSSDLEEESEYDKLPPLKRLTRSQIARLDKEQKKAYFDEVDYREKLFMKKQWKDKRCQRRSMKKIKTREKNEKYKKHMEEEVGTAELTPISMPDVALPPSFDADSPAYRYRFLDTVSQWLVQPVLESYGWDHDIGYEGLNLEKTFVIGSKIPVSISGQVIKDKDEANLQLECAASVKHGEGKMTLARLDIQNIGKEVSYTLHSETRFSNFKYNKIKAGMAFTLLGDSLSVGMKLEDILMIGKRFKVVLNGGTMSDRGGLAYGGNLEATLRDKDYPIGGKLATLGLSVMNSHEGLAFGFNLQSHFGIGRNTSMDACANFNRNGKGQASVCIRSFEQLQIALVGVIPIIKALIGHRFFSWLSVDRTLSPKSFCDC